MNGNIKIVRIQPIKIMVKSNELRLNNRKTLATDVY